MRKKVYPSIFSNENFKKMSNAFDLLLSNHQHTFQYLLKLTELFGHTWISLCLFCEYLINICSCGGKTKIKTSAYV